MPSVTIVVPCYNEQARIGLLLAAIYRQNYDRSAIEVVIADGMSTDNTRVRIAEFQHAHPDITIKIVDNPQRTIPSGLNTTLKAAGGDYIVRLDAHCEPYPDYLMRCISLLTAGQAENVGGILEIQPGSTGWVARAIAHAAAHPLGVGDAFYRLGSTSKAVDTVPFGSFKRELFNRIGLYNESLLTNEDYELNARIRKAGGKVWLDPTIRSRYYARSTIPELARQYWRYGFWKGRMIRLHPKTTRWRQLLPPAFLLSLLTLLCLSIWFPVAFWLFWLVTMTYISVLVIAGILHAFRKRDYALMIGLPLAISVMHIAWGTAFLWNFLSRSK